MIENNQNSVGRVAMTEVIDEYNAYSGFASADYQGS